MMRGNSTVVMCLAVFIVGCASSGTVHEQRSIAPGQRIGILWNVGYFPDPHISEVMIRHRTHERAYESCTNAVFERTFGANGYTVRAIKGQTLDRRLAEAAYVLVLQNKSAGYPTIRDKGSLLTIASLPFVQLNMDATLYERQSGKRLWSMTDWLATDATQNGHAVMRLIRALAADGFLKIKADDVVDYLGQHSASSNKRELGCP